MAVRHPLHPRLIERSKVTFDIFQPDLRGENVLLIAPGRGQQRVDLLQYFTGL